MKDILSLGSFERSLKRLDPPDLRKVVLVLEKFNDFAVTGELPAGLGFKKLRADLFEIRVDIRLRILIKIDSTAFYLVLAGNHDDIHRYLRG
jgi:hypothetical protein